MQFGESVGSLPDKEHETWVISREIDRRTDHLRQGPRVTMPPVAIILLLEYYFLGEPVTLNSPARQEYHSRFLKWRLIEAKPGDENRPFQCTDRGVEMVERWIHTPLPE